MTTQLTLNIKLRDDATFANFITETNGELLRHLEMVTKGEGEQCSYIWGMPGTGKSHLLQACCHHAIKNKLSAIYIPLTQDNLRPDVLEDLEEINVICLDDIETVIGNSNWEEGIFHLFNRVREAGRHLVISASEPPNNLHCVLPDLQSRLSWGLVFKLQALDDEQKQQVLYTRAKARGIDVPASTVQYLLNNYSRDVGYLLGVLEQLDQESLRTHHKLTIPFVKKVISK